MGGWGVRGSPSQVGGRVVWSISRARSQLGRTWPDRLVRDGDVVVGADGHRAVGAQDELKAVLVDEGVVAGADQDQLPQA